MSEFPHPPRPHRLRLAGIILIIVAALALGGYCWLVSAAKKTLNERLAQRGLSLKSAGQSWSPWDGLSLKEAVLRRLSAGNEPLIELSALHVDILWREAWKTRAAVTRWQTQDAKLTLHDAQGAVTLEHFTTDFVLRDGRFDIARLDTSNGPLAFVLTGQILTGADDASQSETGFSLNLKPVRAVLESLNVKPGTGPLTLSGSFAFDLRPSPSLWNATLHGAGKQVEWRGVPMRETELDAQVSQAELKLAASVKFAQGSVKIDLTRAGWDQTPLKMSGTLTDSAGREDEFSGRNEGSTGVLTIAKLSGEANLIELAQNVPALAGGLPSSLKVKTFPDIAAKDFVWRGDDSPPTWTLASVQLRKPAEIVVMIRDHPLAIDKLSGGLSRDHGAWNFDSLKGRLLGGSFALDGSYDGNTLSKASVSLHSLQLAQLRPWAGKVSAGLDDSDLSLAYKGSICSSPVHSTGSGTLELTHAPEVHLPLVDQAYDLFPTLLPHDHRGGTGELEVAFSMNKGMASIDPLKARSTSVTVTATGTVDLVKRRVAGQARANLRGIAGIATAPLSHVLTEMQVSGPLDDIRVSPLSVGAAAKNLITSPVKAAKGTVKTSARLSSGVLREGLSLPFEALGIFGEGKGKAAE